MRARPLGSTGLEVTELSLGTWGLSGEAYGQVPERERAGVVERALALGIRVFETADCYAKGSLETLLGERLKSHPEAVVVTKLGTRLDSTPPKKDFSREYLAKAVDRSLYRLKRDRIDCVLLHNPSDRAFARPELPELMKQLCESKKVTCWGASVGSVDAGRAALEAGAEVLELPYNVFHDQELRQLSTTITENKVGILARSVLAHGLLCGAWAQSRAFGASDHRADRWTPDAFRRRIQQLSAIRPSISPTLPTLRAIALRYALSNERVSSVVLGPRNLIQLDQLVREAGKGPPYIESGQLEFLERRLAAAGVTR